MKSSSSALFRIFRASSYKELKHFGTSRFSRIISWVLIFSILNLSNGCKYYYRVTAPKKPDINTINDLYIQNKQILLHLEDKIWQLSDVKIEENNILGTISTPTSPTKYPETDPTVPNSYRSNSKVDESWVLNEVHIHIVQMIDLGNSNVTFSFEDVRSIQIYKRDGAATDGSLIVGLIGIPLLLFGLLMLIIILTKSSCPFIYVFDGEKYVFQGEIYSGAIYPPLERHDYLKLPVFDKNAGSYTLKITNEVHEIQHTNLCELLVFDHPKGVEVLIDKYSTHHFISSLVKPSSAVNLNGYNVRETIVSKDSLSYFSCQTSKDQLLDGIILEYPMPENAKQAKVVLRAKNTFILDYMIGQFHDLFGNKYHGWVRIQKKEPEEMHRRWSLDQNIPLSLFVEKNGEWHFVDYYHIAGPMALKDDVLSIPLDENTGNPLRVKLEWGANFWEVDYVAVDYTENNSFKSYTIPLKSAITNKSKDIRNKLLADDKKYYIQPNVGDEAVLSFDLPKPTDAHRSIILHTKGYYEILRDPEGKPNISYLKTFTEPGQFNRFCNERLGKALNDVLSN